jgi:Fe-S-cluster-containing dehydrogenase component
MYPNVGEDDCAGRSRDAGDHIGELPHDRWFFYLPRTCAHCTYPACLAACPRKAIYKREEDGIVLIDQARCKGYGECVRACPYKKSMYNPHTRTSEKCVGCYPAVEQGMQPQCVVNCIGKIRVMGFINPPWKARKPTTPSTTSCTRSRSRCPTTRSSASSRTSTTSRRSTRTASTSADVRAAGGRGHRALSGRDEAGRLGQYSDAAAVEFPVRAEGAPPPVMMGAKGDPVHMFHWRAQYQRDKEKGKPTMRDLYPNMTVDAYPLEYADQGSLRTPTEGAREQYSPGVAVGNPQSYGKTGVDEVVAEGFATSSVQEGHGSAGEAVWANDEWVLVISRRLVIEGGSSVAAGRKTFMGFAVWQGGAAEVGSRKAVTMAWTPLSVEAAQ